MVISRPTIEYRPVETPQKLLECPKPPDTVPDPDTATDKDLADFTVALYDRLTTCNISVKSYNDYLKKQVALSQGAPAAVAKRQ